MKQFIKDLPLIMVILVGCFVADVYIRSSEAAQRFVGPKEFSAAIVKEWRLLFT
jgi:hypothetical protein